MFFLHIIFTVMKPIPILETLMQFILAFPVSALTVSLKTFRLKVLFILAVAHPLLKPSQ